MPSLLLPRTVPGTALIAFLLIGTSACGLRQPAPPVDRSQDERIRGEVMARVAAEPSLDGTEIRVDVEAAMVMLYGRVAGIGAWQCAITNAELVAGVSSVVDYLVIDRGERDVRCLAPRPDSSYIVGEP